MPGRAAGLVGRCEPRMHHFMNIVLEHAADVLLPRKETELLAAAAIAILRGLPSRPLVVDMCCGSGNLALSIAVEVPSARVWGGDLTDSTVMLARRNVKRLAVQDRVTIRQGDLFEALEGEGLEGALDMVVCNPPYISTARLTGESAHLLEAGPREAFDGGPYGISIKQRVIREAADFLTPGGWLLLEFGERQERQVAALIARTRVYEPVTFVSNEAGMPRVALARKLGPVAAPPLETAGRPK